MSKYLYFKMGLLLLVLVLGVYALAWGVLDGRPVAWLAGAIALALMILAAIGTAVRRLDRVLYRQSLILNDLVHARNGLARTAKGLAHVDGRLEVLERLSGDFEAKLSQARSSAIENSTMVLRSYRAIAAMQENAKGELRAAHDEITRALRTIEVTQESALGELHSANDEVRRALGTIQAQGMGTLDALQHHESKLQRLEGEGNRFSIAVSEALAGIGEAFGDYRTANEAAFGELIRTATGMSSQAEEIARSTEEAAGHVRQLKDKIEAMYGSEGRLRSLSQRVLAWLKTEIMVEVAALDTLARQLPVGGRLPAVTSYSMEPSSMVQVIEKIAELRPKCVVELGGGSSTLWIAKALEEIGEGTLVSVEHLPQYFESTRRLIEVNGLAQRVDMRLAPLEPLSQEQWAGHGWYSMAALEDLPAPIDILLVDGPPESTGPDARKPAFPLIREKLNDVAFLLVDDATRKSEREMVESWRKDCGDLGEPIKLSSRMVMIPFIRGRA